MVPQPNVALAPRFLEVQGTVSVTLYMYCQKLLLRHGQSHLHICTTYFCPLKYWLKKMEVSTPEPRIENPTDRYPLLVEPQQNNEHPGHVIDIERACGASSSSSCRNGSSRGSNMPHHDVRMSSTVPLTVPQLPPSPLNGSNSRRSSVARGGEGSGRRRWSPFNVVLWLWIQLLFTVGQLIAAIFVLSVSTKEYSQTRLLAWIMGYAVGSAASLPVIYWRYLHQNQARSSEREGGQTASSGSWNGQTVRVPNARLSAMMDHLKMALDCFFAIWFVVGNVWIFGGHSSSSDAPNLYRLCIVFLAISSIGYAMPFFLCSMICCCLPCIVSILGVRDNLIRMRGASEETITALPTHKFKSMKKMTQCSGDSAPGVDDGGFVAAGTERERIISGEDAVCCICLASYSDNDEVKELPCSHFFHTKCIDKWLKINASCPLCKLEIGDRGNS